MSSTADRAGKIMAAVFDRIITNEIVSVPAERLHTMSGLVNKSTDVWLRDFPDSQPQFPADIHITFRQVKRPVLIPYPIGKIFLNCDGYYIDACLPQTKLFLIDPMEHILEILPKITNTPFCSRIGSLSINEYTDS